ARGTTSLSTTGRPSPVVASATKASVGSSYPRPTVIDQSCSSWAISVGRAASHSVTPAASAFARTAAGISTTVRALQSRRGRSTGFRTTGAARIQRSLTLLRFPLAWVHRHAERVAVQRKDAEPRYEGGLAEINFIEVLRP